MRNAEIATGKYDLSLFSHPKDYPLRNSFAPSPRDAAVKKDPESKKEDFDYKWLAPDYKIPPDSADSIRYCSHFRSSGDEIALGWNEDRPISNEKWRMIHLSNSPKPLLLVDSCSRFRAILRVHPRSGDLCAKLLLNHLRDLRQLITISLIDSSTNLGAVETNRAGSLAILSKFMLSGMFNLSPVGRNKVNVAKESAAN